MLRVAENLAVTQGHSNSYHCTGRNFLSVLNGNYVLSCAISELFTSQDIHY